MSNDEQTTPAAGFAKRFGYLYLLDVGQAYFPESASV